MKSRKLTIFAIAAAILLIAVVIFVAFFLHADGDTPAVLLPQTTAQTGSPTGDEPGTADDGLSRAEVRVDTVQTVIASLNRPEQYRRSLTVESFWATGSAQWTVSADIQGGNATLLISGAENKSVRIEDNTLTIWYDSYAERYEAALDSEEAVARLQDEFQMLYTYEDILALNQADIRAADYGSYDGKPYIHVETVSGTLGYRSVWYISVDNGLLERMEVYDGDTLIYRLSAGEAELDSLGLTGENP